MKKTFVVPVLRPESTLGAITLGFVVTRTAGPDGVGVEESDTLEADRLSLGRFLPGTRCSRGARSPLRDRALSSGR